MKADVIRKTTAVMNKTTVETVQHDAAQQGAVKRSREG